jgi:hypothetical protein
MRPRPQFSYASTAARLSWSDPIPVHCAGISPLPISEKQLPRLPQLFPNRGVRSRTPPRIRSLEVHRIAALQDWHLIRRSSHSDMNGPRKRGANKKTMAAMSHGGENRGMLCVRARADHQYEENVLTCHQGPIFDFLRTSFCNCWPIKRIVILSTHPLHLEMRNNPCAARLANDG